MNSKLITNFFNHGSTAEIAQKLLGKRFIYHRTSAWIVETEAYIGIRDQAAHAYHGRKTHRNRALYMKPGTIYVFSIYGQNLLNFITQPQGIPEGVLIRAVQPENGLPLMEKRRRTNLVNLTNGPGKLCQAMNINLGLNTQRLNQSPMKIDLSSSLTKHPAQIHTSSRVGVPHKGKWTSAPLRYYVAGNPYVSKMPKGRMDFKYQGWQIKS